MFIAFCATLAKALLMSSVSNSTVFIVCFLCLSFLLCDDIDLVLTDLIQEGFDLSGFRPGDGSFYISKFIISADLPPGNNKTGSN